MFGFHEVSWHQKGEEVSFLLILVGPPRATVHVVSLRIKKGQLGGGQRP